MDTENVVTDNSNTEEATPIAAENTEGTVEQSDDIDTVKERLAKAEELANNYKIRAEKAEKKAKEPVRGTENKTELSTKEMVALMNAKVHEEDIDEVVDFAKFKKLSVTDALKSTTVKALLAERSETRKTAEATSTGNRRVSSTKLSDEAIIANAAKGKLPESDDDMDRLVQAEISARKAKKR